MGIGDDINLIKVPAQNSLLNLLMRDAVGNKTDTSIGDSLMGHLKEVENHLHNFEKWFGLAGTPAGETHRADRMDGVISPFALLSGSSDFGNWVQVLGSDDTPVQAGKVKFDFHRTIVIDTDSTAPFIIQIIAGESTGFAAKLAAEDFGEFPYVASSNNNDSGISELIDERYDSGEKVWFRAACVGQNAKTINLYIGIHEYN